MLSAVLEKYVFAQNENGQEQALFWFQKSAEQGNHLAQNYMGKIFENSQDEEVANWYRKAAEQGNRQASESLGRMYFVGRGVVNDFEEAANWYRKSTPKNTEKEWGDGSSERTDVSWLRKAALKGHARAQNRLAEIYEQGTGVPKSYKECLKWYTRAAHQGDDQAQLALGRLLEASGESAEALVWFHKAGEQGNYLAQAELGDHYQTGGNDDQAFKWFRLAAEHGHGSAQYHLGLMHRNGRGTPVDFQEAIHWLRRSAEQDHLPAIGALQKLEHSLKV